MAAVTILSIKSNVAIVRQFGAKSSVFGTATFSETLVSFIELTLLVSWEGVNHVCWSLQLLVENLSFLVRRMFPLFASRTHLIDVDRMVADVIIWKGILSQISSFLRNVNRLLQCCNLALFESPQTWDKPSEFTLHVWYDVLSEKLAYPLILKNLRSAWPSL